MKTSSVFVQSLCVPCSNRCRHCLLSWDGKLPGAEFEQSRAYAERMHRWLKANRPELSFGFYFGYSMDHPKLTEAIDFMNSIGSPGGSFLQMDGLEFKSACELRSFLCRIKEHGVKLIDLTFYGTREYHDRFAARIGDFDYLFEILRTANEIGLDCEIGIALTAESAPLIDELIVLLEKHHFEKLFCFIPHNEGRGRFLNSIRLSKSDFEKLSEKAKRYLNLAKYKTEKEWLAVPPKPAKKRMVTISLTKENIEQFEQMSFDDAIAYVEELDNRFHLAVENFEALAALYGDKNGERFFSAYDLELYYQQRYIKENSLEIYDIHDERQCFARRF